ncbi:hypothetical protein TREMEDRAFT_72891 [Tremella mesenterica DSM 1558]|uniref:uncharacterized protein n=1 Tax=Tremella mesenterica (strain ATCC 24925 / CBS 8224 / DSM 1558 / NBRC 9311 / NRRL Y-6157 / RJB 2259-6 / UBC 559-6) TaxID=578456 RepID=UPI0003F48EEF|nr:uncharacterized protein TREMEDRAFT_72891 [Tremella mesenterica DSM 1558]EIW72815.1 hypothetical protein TREMEDRAFT_72891 [Tremella mesenterica DSM 1558]
MSKAHMVQGHKEMREKKYSEALSSFNRAYSLGDRSLAVFDCKAAAMSRIPGWEGSAYQITLDMCAKYERDFRPWYRKADVLRILHSYRAAMESARQALSRINSSSEHKRHIVETLVTRIQSEGRQARAKHFSKMKDDVAAEAAMKAARRARERNKTDYTGLLSPDVLILIAQFGLEADSNFASRMERTCRRWRDVIRHTPALWRKLVFGSGKATCKEVRPASKANLWLQRSGGSIHTLVVRDHFDCDKVKFDTLLVELNLEAVRTIDASGLSPRYLKKIIPSCPNLKMFRTTSYCTQHQISSYSDVTTLFSSMVDWEETLPCSLEHVSLTGVAVTISTRSVNQKTNQSSSPIYCMEKLKTVRMVGCLVTAGPRLRDFFQLVPNAEIVVLDGTHFQYEAKGPEDTVLHLPHLRSYSQTHLNDGLVFDTIVVPNLKRLELNAHGPLNPDARIIDQLLAPGLADALSNLEVLDIGKAAIDQEHLIEVLRQMTSLRFLNVSFCGLDDGFLSALTRKTDEQSRNMLPNLEALSIACSDITTGALKDFVVSRTRSSHAFSFAATSSSNSSTTVKGSAFRPSAPKKPSVISSSTTHTTTPITPPSSQLPSHSSQSSTLAATQNTTLAHLRWLCADHCEDVDSSMIMYLRTRLTYLSHWLGTFSIDRVRGKNRYAWDGGWTNECGTGEENRCGLRKRIGTEDEWYVYHVCERREVSQEAPSWSQLPKDHKI